MKNEKIIGSDIMNDAERKNDFMKMDRRTFVKVAGATVGALALGRLDMIPNAAAAPKVKFNKFVDPLITAIPKLTPDTTTYEGKDYYEIYMAPGNLRFSSQLPIPPLNSTWGYGSNYNTDPTLPNQSGPDVFLGYLGPTIEAQQDRHVVVKFKNNLPTTHPLQAAIDPTVPDSGMYPGLVPGRATPHLHGGFTDPKFDGHPHSWFTAGGAQGTHYDTLQGALPGEAIFEFSNEQLASGLWYHDHAMGITRLNAYAGLAALYFIRDTQDTGLPGNPLGLPAGQYEIPLVIQDKQFNPDGSLFYPTIGLNAVHKIWVPEFFGDTAVVNAQTFPFLNVEPRRYRFRIVNGSQARFYNMWLQGNKNLPIWIIGMEQSLLPKAVPLQKLLLAPGERADVIIDFTGINPGTSLILSNDANTPYPGAGGRGGRGGIAIPDIMQFNVIAPIVGSPPDTTTLPASLVLPAITALVATPGAPVREIVMKETLDPVTLTPIHVRLNELWFNEMIDTGPNTVPIDENPTEGTTEIWQFINLTVDAHPMHMHLVKFQVLNRQAFDVAAYTTAYLAWAAIIPRDPATKPVLANYLGNNPILPPAPEESGWKDTVKAYPGQITRVISTFDLPSGVNAPAEYVYHCHILEHEENEMMRPMQVV